MKISCKILTKSWHKIQPPKMGFQKKTWQVTQRKIALSASLKKATQKSVASLNGFRSSIGTWICQATQRNIEAL